VRQPATRRCVRSEKLFLLLTWRNASQRSLLPIFLNCCGPATAKSLCACYIDRRKQEPANNKEGAMRVRVAASGRLLGLDTGDWSTLIAGSMLAGLLAFFM
jgi:hypothetical protein